MLATLRHCDTGCVLRIRPVRARPRNVNCQQTINGPKAIHHCRIGISWSIRQSTLDTPSASLTHVSVCQRRSFRRHRQSAAAITTTARADGDAQRQIRLSFVRASVHVDTSPAVSRLFDVSAVSPSQPSPSSTTECPRSSQSVTWRTG